MNINFLTGCATGFHYSKNLIFKTTHLLNRAIRYYSPFFLYQTNLLDLSFLIKKIEERKDENFETWGEGHKGDVYSNIFTKRNRLMRASDGREQNPKELWKAFHSNPNIVFLGQPILLQNINNLDSTGISRLLEERGGRGLANISTEAQKLIWQRCKELKDFDLMVEIFHCNRPSSFTCSKEILADYLFAQLNSSYSNPHLVEEFAKRLKGPKAIYLEGLSLAVQAVVAKKMDENLKETKLNSQLMRIYEDCFPQSDSYHDSHEIYPQIKSKAIAALLQAEIEEPNIKVRIKSMIEQLQIEE